MAYLARPRTFCIVIALAVITGTLVGRTIAQRFDPTETSDNPHLSRVPPPTFGAPNGRLHPVSADTTDTPCKHAQTACWATRENQEPSTEPAWTEAPLAIESSADEDINVFWPYEPIFPVVDFDFALDFDQSTPAPQVTQAGFIEVIEEEASPAFCDTVHALVVPVLAATGVVPASSEEACTATTCGGQSKASDAATGCQKLVSAKPNCTKSRCEESIPQLPSDEASEIELNFAWVWPGAAKAKSNSSGPCRKSVCAGTGTKQKVIVVEQPSDDASVEDNSLFTTHQFENVAGILNGDSENANCKCGTTDVKCNTSCVCDGGICSDCECDEDTPSFDVLTGAISAHDRGCESSEGLLCQEATEDLVPTFEEAEIQEIRRRLGDALVSDLFGIDSDDDFLRALRQADHHSQWGGRFADASQRQWQPTWQDARPTYGPHIATAEGPFDVPGHVLEHGAHGHAHADHPHHEHVHDAAPWEHSEFEPLISTLRESARMADIQAADLEDQDRYDEAEKLRRLAGKLRRQARELR